MLHEWAVSQQESFDENFSHQGQTILKNILNYWREQRVQDSSLGGLWSWRPRDYQSPLEADWQTLKKLFNVVPGFLREKKMFRP